ncbi:MAG: DUF6291 domain-containing protein [Rikenellaceae bacterium]
MSSKENSFVFYGSFYESIDMLNNPEVELQLFKAIARYALHGVEPQLDGIAAVMWALMKPNIDAGLIRRNNAKKGGAPNGNRNAKGRLSNNTTIVVSDEQPELSELNNCTLSDVDVDVDVDVDKDVEKDVDEECECETHTHELSKVFFEWVKINAPSVLSFAEPLTPHQESEIRKNDTNTVVLPILKAMHNNGEYKKRQSAYLTFEVYLKNHKPEKSEQGKEYTYNQICDMAKTTDDWNRFKKQPNGKWRTTS